MGDGREGEGWDPADDAADAVNHAEHRASDELDLDDDDRLPWLETAEEDYDEDGVDTARVFGFVIAGLLTLAILIGGIWWFSHRKPDPMLASGDTIPAPSEPYKEAPKQPGGKTFAGTGDTSYSVAQGKKAGAQLSGGGEAPKPSLNVGGAAAGAAAAAGAGAAANPAAAPATGGVGVQVGAFATSASAEAGWNTLVGRSSALKGARHRVVEGTADIGKVYRLQAVAANDGEANALCGRLKAAGIACQVKR